MNDLPEWKLKYITERVDGEFVLPEPNEFVWSIRDLRFGKREYEEERHVQGGKVLWDNFRRPNNWRELVGDKYADMPIASDIDGLGSFLPFGEIYDPYALEEMLIHHPTIVKEVNNLSLVGFKQNELRPVKIAANSVFRAHYKYVFQKSYDEAKARIAEVHEQRRQYCPHGEPLPVPYWFDEGPDRQWKQACKQFDAANELICLFICRHFTLYRNHWTPLLVEHADLSQYYKHFTMRELKPRRPMPLE